MQQRSNSHVNTNSVLTNAMKGAVAGAVGVWVMDRIDWFMFNHENPAARRRTEYVRPDGLDPAHVAVNKVARTFGTGLSPAQPHPAGVATHYALGIGPGAIYAALRERLSMRNSGTDHLYGMGLGLGLYLIQDQAVNRMMGLSASPRHYPWQAHARGLIAHLVLGLVTNTVLNLLQAPRPRSASRGQASSSVTAQPVTGNQARSSLNELEQTFLISPGNSSNQGRLPSGM